MNNKNKKGAVLVEVIIIMQFIIIFTSFVVFYAAKTSNKTSVFVENNEENILYESVGRAFLSDKGFIAKYGLINSVFVGYGYTIENHLINSENDASSIISKDGSLKYKVYFEIHTQESIKYEELNISNGNDVILLNIIRTTDVTDPENPGVPNVQWAYNEIVESEWDYLT